MEKGSCESRKGPERYKSVGKIYGRFGKVVWRINMTNTPILLASTQSFCDEPTAPLLVLIHGLDSTKSTWKALIEECQDKYNMIAFDLRGHGESDFESDEVSFGISTLIGDIRHSVQHHQNNTPEVKIPFVLVGHSMGGLIAMAYAAQFPEDLIGVIIEDIDILPRKIPSITQDDMERRRQFSREFTSWESLRLVLLQWYDASRVDSWREDGRVFERQDGTWWSGVNPFVKQLAMECVLGPRGVGMAEWRSCCRASTTAQTRFFVAVFVAGTKSACADECLASMTQVMDEERRDAAWNPLRIIRFSADAFHSIHNTSLEEFCSKLDDVLGNPEPASANLLVHLHSQIK